MNNGAETYVGMVNGELVAHIGFIQFPMRKGWKRVHRLVVLPDYQGIGIGTAFQNAVAQDIFERGFNVNCTTTTPSLFNAMQRDKDWALVRFGRVNSTLEKNFSKYYGRSVKTDKSKSSNRVTYSFNYLGKEDGKRKRIKVNKKSKRK